MFQRDSFVEIEFNTGAKKNSKQLIAYMYFISLQNRETYFEWTNSVPKTYDLRGPRTQQQIY